ncbi:MAG: sulfatase-like hydrolase/transferase [Thermoanaerobaculales bacterium]|nr:sulfatase-like hydrolase/transferase [Thermoanaerobaculales bacterium]
MSRGRAACRRVAALALCLAATLACGRSEVRRMPAGGGGPQRPSILLLTLDTTRADHLAPYGAAQAETPALAALAASGIVFDDALATTPVTAPSHASLLSGLYPPRHGVRNNSTHYLAAEVPTLAERLAAEGFRTAAFVSTVILERRYGLDQGFELYDDDIRSIVGRPEDRITGERRADATVDRALAWLDGLEGDAPFLLWVHLYDPHIPYLPPEPWAARHPGRPYDGEIAFMDAQIGRLLAHPRAAPEHTAVMAIGDHGESLGEHGERTHGLLIYDATIRIPWIARLPGGPAGARVAAPVSQVDLVPTILDLLELEPDDGLAATDGRSLLPLLGPGAQAPERLLFAESEVPFFAYGWARLRSARDGRLKLIAAPTAELYDLGPDPRELRNLAAERPADVRRLADAIEAWTAAAGAADSTLSVDAETAGMLRALGYAAGDTARPAGAGRGNPVELMPVHDELQAVGSLLANGRPEEAVRRARGALAMDPDNLAGLRDLSRGLVQLGRLDEAAEAADRAVAVAPWSAEAFTVAADVAHRRGANARALELVDRGLALDPRFLEARVERSRYLAALGRSAEAAAELAALLERTPDDNWVALRYAELVELPAGDFAAAERRLRQVLARNPSFAEAWLLLGTVLTRAGRGAEAAEVYRQAAAAGTIDPDSQGRAALLLASAGDPAAESALRGAIAAAEVARPELHLAYAELLAAAGRSGEARQHLELAAAAPAGSVAARNDAAKALLLLGRDAEAEAGWRALIADRPEDFRAWLNLATLALQRGDWSEGERLGRAAVERAPASANAWNSLAVALDELGRSAEAEAAYRRANELDPADWRPLFNLGILLREATRFSEAAAIQEEVLARAPRHPGAHFELGALYAGPLGQPARARPHLEAARPHLEAAIAADPDHPRARQARAILERLP